MPFRVSAPCPVLLDPTRRLMGARRLKIFARDEVRAPPAQPMRRPLIRTQCEMHHYSMVRKDIRSKLENVSNRGNYDAGARGGAPCGCPPADLAAQTWTPLCVPSAPGAPQPGLCLRTPTKR